MGTSRNKCSPGPIVDIATGDHRSEQPWSPSVLATVALVLAFSASGTAVHTATDCCVRQVADFGLTFMFVPCAAVGTKADQYMNPSCAGLILDHLPSASLSAQLDANHITALRPGVSHTPQHSPNRLCDLSRMTLHRSSTSSINSTNPSPTPMSSITPPKDGFNCLGDRNGYNRGRKSSLARFRSTAHHADEPPPRLLPVGVRPATRRHNVPVHLLLDVRDPTVSAAVVA